MSKSKSRRLSYVLDETNPFDIIKCYAIACMLVVNLFMVNNLVSLFRPTCAQVGRALELVLSISGHSEFNWWFYFAPVFQWCCLTPQCISRCRITFFSCRVHIFDSSQVLSLIVFVSFCFL